MEFIWAGKKNPKNTLISFTLELREACDTMTLAVADIYNIYFDGKFIGYGPERTANGYTRAREFSVKGVRTIEVRAYALGAFCYSIDTQPPHFAAELFRNGKTVYTSRDFRAFTVPEKLDNTTRYSIQRTFVEFYDFRNTGAREIEIYPVDAPTVLPGVGDVAEYRSLPLTLIGEGDYSGFEKIVTPRWEAAPNEGDLTVNEHFLDDAARGGYREMLFRLPSQRTGFIKLDIDAEEDTKIFVLFEERLDPDGGWSTFRRSDCNEIVGLTVPNGELSFQSFEPYTMQFMKIIYKGKLKSIVPSLTLFENDRSDKVTISGDTRLVKIFEAARSTFRQNAVDIYMDCPGRERAGWLCDSYFTSQAELFFTGRSDIERCFCENFIIAKTPELPENMLPMCFPGEHVTFIPNWAMWFVIELGEYLERTGDRELVDRAREKIYGLTRYFEKFRNSDGLLEDLDGWIFVEWSISNDKEYVSGVNYPSNMLYAKMLRTVADLFSDKELLRQAEDVQAKILEQSWNGEFFADNATRDEGGALIRRDDHVSETCQYYALFTGVKTDESFKEKMTKEFGPLRPKENYPKIGRSNMFIGNYLRFFWLASRGEYSRILDECLEYLEVMADTTGTLWEGDASGASCNHGFASVVGMLIARCTVGYETVRDGKPVFIKGFTPDKDYGVEFEFNY